MYLNSYIKTFGKNTFKEKRFNHVDALVLAALSYINLDLVLNKESDGSFLLKDIDLSNIDDLVKGEFDAKKNKVLLPLMMKSNRFKNIRIKNIEIVNDAKDATQFYAFCVLLEGIVYITIRGTDLTLKGWKEDVNMLLQEKVPSQNIGLKYLQKIAKQEEGNIIIAGHSKGGVVAEYAGLFCDEYTQSRITHIYSFDGPGFYNDKLTKEAEESPFRNKLIKFVPKNTVVGIMLKGTKHSYIVDAAGVGVFQHDPFNWKIDNEGKFIILKRRANISYINEKALTEWIDSLDKEDLRLVMNLMFDTFGDLNVDLVTLRDDWWNTWRKLNNQYKTLKKKEKKRLNALALRFLKINTQQTINFYKAQRNKPKQIENKQKKSPTR